MPHLRRSSVPLALLLAVTAAACSSGPTETAEPRDRPVTMAEDPTRSGLHGTPVDPPLPRPTQRLRDTSGDPFSMATRPKDELTVLFFGYTHCPDVCPTTMADLAGARNRVPAAVRDRVTVVFVTEDPGRDRPRPLRRWLDGFDPSFVGLAGGNRATKAMLEQLYLPETQRVADPEDPIEHPDHGGPHHRHGEYGIDHAGVVYAFGPGDSTVVYSGGTTPAEYAADFTTLLDSAGEQ